MMRVALPTLLLALTTACSQLAGLGDYGEAVPASGGGGSGGAGGPVGGATATGGGALGIPAADWTSSFEVVYRFDEDDWGLDEGAGGQQALSFSADVGTDTLVEGIPQGAGALRINSLSARTDATGPPFEPNGDSLTFGAWLRFDVSVVGPSHPIGVLDLYTLRRSNALRLRCGFENETTGAPALVDADGAEWASGIWVHAVCRWDAASGNATAQLTFGEELAYGEAADVAFATEPLDSFVLGKLSAGSPGMTGWLDEVFVTEQALTNEAVTRIHACGIDGRLCLCDEAAPMSYVDCGRRAPSCSALPPCDTPTPPTLAP